MLLLAIYVTCVIELPSPEQGTEDILTDTITEIILR